MKLSLLLFALVLFVPVQASEDWIADEIFKQIAELKRDNNQLRKEVEQLKFQRSNLKKVAAISE